MTAPFDRSPGFRLQRGLAHLPASLRGGAVAIGNFDGVHRGHQAVIAAAKVDAESYGGPALALTFEPHPRQFFAPAAPLFRLTPLPVKARLLEALGLSGAVVLAFDRYLASLEAEDFIEQTLVNALGIRHVVIGFDFHFGRGRGGTPDFLAESARRHGFGVHIVPPLGGASEPVSSTRIRLALSQGNIAEATDLLGYTWFVEAAVRHGEKRGRGLGYPTANLALDPGTDLAHGIYAVKALIGDLWRPAVASFGRRPTFDNGAPLLEVHLFDFAGDLYGKTLLVAFIEYLRPEQRFENVGELVRQMGEDGARARGLLARSPDDPLLARIAGLPSRPAA
jgi:riboflavin kinase/FMN adenylyltransferase